MVRKTSSRRAALAGELLDADPLRAQGGADFRAAMLRPFAGRTSEVDHAVDLRHQVDARHLRQRLQHLRSRRCASPALEPQA